MPRLWKRTTYLVLAAVIYLNIGYVSGIHYYKINQEISLKSNSCFNRNLDSGYLGHFTSERWMYGQVKQLIDDCDSEAIIAVQSRRSKHVDIARTVDIPVIMPGSDLGLKIWTFAWPIPIGIYLISNIVYGSFSFLFSSLEKIWGSHNSIIIRQDYS